MIIRNKRHRISGYEPSASKTVFRARNISGVSSNTRQRVIICRHTPLTLNTFLFLKKDLNPFNCYVPSSLSHMSSQNLSNLSVNPV